MLLQMPTLPTEGGWIVTAISALAVIVYLYVQNKGKVQLKEADVNEECRKKVEKLERHVQRLETAVGMMNEYVRGRFKDDPTAQAMFNRLDELIRTKDK